MNSFEKFYLKPKGPHVVVAQSPSHIAPPSKKITIGPFHATLRPLFPGDKNTPALNIKLDDTEVVIFTADSSCSYERWDATKCVHAVFTKNRHPRPVPQKVYDLRADIDAVFDGIA